MIDSCTVLTTDSGADVADVHPRMPVILSREDFAAWLDPASEDGRLRALMKPVPAGALDRVAVTRAVNDPRFDEPACLRPDPADADDAAEPDAPEAEGPATGQGELFAAGEGAGE